MQNYLESQGIVCHGYKVSEPLYTKHLKEKLLEETLECQEALTETEYVEELADLLEVLYALGKAQGISPDTIEKKRQAKAEKSGGLEEGFYVEYVELSVPNPSVAYFLSRPQKHPELPIS